MAGEKRKVPNAQSFPNANRHGPARLQYNTLDAGCDFDRIAEREIGPDRQAGQPGRTAKLDSKDAKGC